MQKFIFILGMLCFSYSVFTQENVALPFDKIEEVKYTNEEKQYFSNDWGVQVVTNVATPSLMVYQPSADKRNGTSVIIAPGGGLYGLSINSEGVDVANWLVSKGITAFVLKYRLVPTGEDGAAEIYELFESDPDLMLERVGEVMPYSIQDGLNAVTHVRENADKYGLQTDKIGFMGFSAGGAVTMGLAYNCIASNQPDFLVPIYPWTTVMPVQPPADNASPMFIICATDDPLDLAKGSIDLYTAWHQKELNVALQMYARGGHGFGMVAKGLPSDKWIERFYEWAVNEKFVVEK